MFAASHIGLVLFSRVASLVAKGCHLVIFVVLMFS
jgi:hypothetical protein